MIINWESSGERDLHARFNCGCPDKKYIGGPLEDIMKTTIYLSGYNDNYFWETVNKEPRDFKCGCGKVYQQQWKRNGEVIINEIKN